MEKGCGKCKQLKPLTEFHKNKRSKDGLQHRCKPCHTADVRAAYDKNPDLYRERVAEHQRNNPEKMARRELRQCARMLGLDPDLVEAEFNAHGGTCDICGGTPLGRTRTRNNRLSIDHDHKTGELRGFLCHGCNAGLGNFKDDPTLIIAALKYLADHQSKLAGAA